ncbi:MAG: hypothetical protein GY861_28800 [bacterium]|nr:hypothetical protein [bacterium]
MKNNKEWLEKKISEVKPATQETIEEPKKLEPKVYDLEKLQEEYRTLYRVRRKGRFANKKRLEELKGIIDGIKLVEKVNR